MLAKRDPILTIAEVCDELKSSKHTVKSWLYIARKNAEAGKEAV